MYDMYDKYDGASRASVGQAPLVAQPPAHARAGVANSVSPPSRPCVCKPPPLKTLRSFLPPAVPLSFDISPVVLYPSVHPPSFPALHHHHHHHHQPSLHAPAASFTLCPAASALSLRAACSSSVISIRILHDHPPLSSAQCAEYNPPTASPSLSRTSLDALSLVRLRIFTSSQDDFSRPGHHLPLRARHGCL